MSNLLETKKSSFQAKKFYDSLLECVDEPEIIEQKIADLSPEELDQLLDESTMYKSVGLASPEKCVLASVSYLKEAYLKKLVTTGIIGFVYQMMNEYTIDEEELTNTVNEQDFLEEMDLNKDFNVNYEKVYNENLMKYIEENKPELLKDNDNIVFKELEVKLSEDELLVVSTNTKNEILEITAPVKSVNKSKMYDHIQTLIKEQSEEERVVIKRFLDKYFKYDPLNHNQESVVPIVDDPERKLLSTEEVSNLTDVVEKTVYSNIPPNDTYCRFNSYYEVNYDKLRTATENIYGLKPDLDHAVIVYDVVNNQDEAKQFIHKYGGKTKFDILNFPLNKWTLMGAFKENRERISFYNKHNKIIEQIIEQQEKDASLGSELLNNRIKTKKRVNERVFGPDSDEFKQYKKYNPSELESKYGLKMEDLENGDIKVTKVDILNTETNEVLEADDEGCPNDAVEVGIVKINAKDGTTTKSKIYSKSEESLKKENKQ